MEANPNPNANSNSLFKKSSRGSFSTTKRLSSYQDPNYYNQLLDPALGQRSSLSESDGNKRISISSLLSLVSARGVSSSAASSSAGSDCGTVQRSLSAQTLMTSGKGLGPASGQSEAGVSNVTVTTSSSPNSQGQVGNGPQLTPLGTHHTPSLDVVRRSPVPAHPPAPTSNPAARSQPNRDRSRTKRRFSGSTATSSHSQSSERGAQSREKEDTKPAPWGIIGVCALDSKARSKPSRNILNRIIANRDFDVVVFGDKTILDEGMSRALC